MKIKNIIKEEINNIFEMWNGIGMLDPEGLSDFDYKLVEKAWELSYGDNFNALINQCESDECKNRIKEIEKKKFHDEEYRNGDL